jgi:hypothetical protein
MPKTWNRLKYMTRVLLRRNPAGRLLTVFPDDVFLVSYPRSGNTWSRFLIGNLVYPEDRLTFANVESRVPEIYLFPDHVLRALPRPRILKSHEYLDPRYPTVVYIVRDPRDVAVSVYHYAIKRRSIPDNFPIRDFIPRFLAGEFFVDFGTWEENVMSWYATRQGNGRFLWLRYEDMLADPVQELARVATFLQRPASPEALATAVERSSAAEMRNLEKQQSHLWKLTQQTRQDKPFVRAATSGSWQKVLDKASVEAIETAWGSTMRRLGYLPASDRSQDWLAQRVADSPTQVR